MSSSSQFVQLPVEVLTDDRLSSGAQLFLAHLLRWDWGGGCWLTDKQLARALDVSSRSVRNHTKALEKAGRLWVFEDREGMAVRLAVRPGHVYPKPRGVETSKARKDFSTPSRARKVFNYKRNFEVHEATTDYQQIPVLVEPVKQESVNAVVAKEPQNLTEEISIEASETSSEPVGGSTVLNPDNCALEALQDAGVAGLVAQVLATRHSIGRIQAAVNYAQSYRGELLNKPGYVVSALQNGWKLPKWCYRTESAKIDIQELSAAPQVPSPSAGGWLHPASDIPPGWEDWRRGSPHAELWEQVCDAIEGKIQPESFTAWIQPCYISGLSEGTVTLAAPNQFITEWVEEHYLWLVQRIFIEMDRSIRNVTITC